ncbi:MAG: hypothetical protein JW770_04580 [Actinobacteria bacterium]|nr:hypothetical protein [Actinomycetota bacterium]
MAINHKKNGSSEIDIRDIFHVFFKNKWWFVSGFLVIFIAGALFSFFRTPQYNLTSTIQINSIAPEYFEELIKLFPEKASNLIGISYLTVSEEMKSDEMLEELNNVLDMDKKELENSIYVSVEQGGILKLTTVYSEEEATYLINRTLLDMYLEKKEAEINNSYDDLLNETENSMSDMMGKIEDLSGEAGESNNLADKEIELRYEDYYLLEKNRDLLVDNKTLFIDRIVVLQNPEKSNIYKNFSMKRDIVFSFFLAIAVGILLAFAVNYFQSLKLKNK